MFSFLFSFSRVVFLTARRPAVPHAMVVDGAGTLVHMGHPLDPAFEAAVATAASQLAASAAPPKKAAAPPPRVTATEAELKAMRVADLKVRRQGRSARVSGAAAHAATRRC